MTRSISMKINGERQAVLADSNTLLLDTLRYQCDLTGAKLGCGTGDCGACTVVLDGQAVNACLVYAVECEGRHVQTVEGVTREGTGAAIAEEMVLADAVQCGFCTPGIVMSAYALLNRSDSEDLRDADIREALAGNLCRCTGYGPIMCAVRAANERLRS